MLAKQNDLISKENKINTTLINYVELNQFSKDFGKRFVPQQELFAKQAFWLENSHPNTDQYDISPVKIEDPRELPKTLKDIFNVFDKDLINEVTDVQIVFNLMEAAVQQCFVDKQCFEIHKKELFLKNDRILHQIMSQDVMICVLNDTAVFSDYVNLEMKKSESCNKCLDLEAELVKRKNIVERDIYKDQFESIRRTRVRSKEHCDSLIAQLNSKSMENTDLKGQIQEKVFVITSLKNNLRKLKEKEIVENATQIPNATTIAPGIFKLDLNPLAPSCCHHRDYLHEWVSDKQHVEFRRISLTGFRSCTSRSHYRSVSKQTTRISQVTYRRACLMLALEGFPSSL
ncbi:hypothetical protein Tco_1060907 [Tanacetum coccineum]